MVTVSDETKNCMKKTFWGLSTDTLPSQDDVRTQLLPFGNGSLFICIDTRDSYIYDAEGDQWCGES